MLITLEYLKTYIGIELTNSDYDVYLTNQINYYSAVINSHCNRVLEAADYVDKFYNVYGTVMLNQFPVNSVTTFTIDGDASDEYWIDNESGLCKSQPTGLSPRNWGYSHAGSTVEVAYNAGYTVLPFDIQGVVAELCSGAYARKDSDPTQTILKETLQGFSSFTYANINELNPGDHAILLKYTSTLDKYKSRLV